MFTRILSLSHCSCRFWVQTAFCGGWDCLSCGVRGQHIIMASIPGIHQSGAKDTTPRSDGLQQCNHSNGWYKSHLNIPVSLTDHWLLQCHVSIVKIKYLKRLYSIILFYIVSQVFWYTRLIFSMFSLLLFILQQSCNMTFLFRRVHPALSITLYFL